MIGRPTNYKDEYDEQVTEWLAVGKTLASFAEKIGVSYVSIWDWAQAHDNFSYAIKKGREIASKIYAEKFLIDNIENQNINNVIAILYCRNVLKIKTKDDAPPPHIPQDNFNYNEVIKDDN